MGRKIWRWNRPSFKGMIFFLGLRCLLFHTKTTWLESTENLIQYSQRWKFENSRETFESFLYSENKTSSSSVSFEISTILNSNLLEYFKDLNRCSIHWKLTNIIFLSSPLNSTAHVVQYQWQTVDPIQMEVNSFSHMANNHILTWNILSLESKSFFFNILWDY